MRSMRRGQTTTEYMITISVISIALAAILITFSDTVREGTLSVSSYLSTSLSDASHGGDPVQ